MRLDSRVSLQSWFSNDKPHFVSDSLPVTTATRPGRGQIAFAGLLSFLLIAIGIASTPYAGVPLAPVPGFMTAFGAGMLVINALLAALLLGKGATERRSDVIRLGAAYYFVAAIFVPLTLSFKDGFVPGTLIGTVASSVWLWSAWHGGFGLAIAWYALRIDSSRPAPSIRSICLLVTAAVTGVAILTTAGVNFLPSLLWNGQTFFPERLSFIPDALIVIDVVALGLCVRLMARTTEQLWVTVAMVAACLDLWLTVHGANRFALGWYLSKCGSAITSFVVIASLFNDITQLYRNSSTANRLLTELANRDGLTGVRNRRFFDAAVETEWRKAQADRAPLAILMVDVDLFKQFNDQYGHVSGDDCLLAVAQTLSASVRWPSAIVARYGGEEFAIVLPGAGEAEALDAAERVRSAVQKLGIPHKLNFPGCLTISLGVSARVPDPEGTPGAMLRNADSALYLAKNRGRNQVASSSALSRGGAHEVVPFEKRAVNG